VARHTEAKLFTVQTLKTPHGNNPFMIQGRPTGRRKRYYFETEKEAKKEAAKLNLQIAAFGSETVLADTERIMAAECIKMLSPLGKTLYDATHFYRDFLAKYDTSITVSELCVIVRKQFEKRLEEEGASPRHARTMFSCLKKFEARFGDSKIKIITAGEIKKWLGGLPLKLKTKNNNLAYIRIAFRIALNEDPPLITVDPFANIKYFPRMKDGMEKPSTPLTPEEAKRLLDAAEPSVVPFIALGLFAGLRAAEREELNWRDIHLDGPEPEIDLSAKISKLGRRRFIPIQPALKAYLEIHRPASGEGRVISLTCNGNPAYERPFKRSAIKAGLWPFPENSLRDSFCSYRYKVTGSADTVGEEAGHEATMMFKKYRKLIRSMDEANRFWAIRP
jgi:integrase